MSEHLTKASGRLTPATAPAPQVRPVDLGLLILGLLWLAGGLLFAFLGGEMAPRGLTLIALVVLPALLFAGAGFALSRLRHLQRAAEGLQAELDALRQAQLSRTQASAATIRPAASAPAAAQQPVRAAAPARPRPAAQQPQAVPAASPAPAGGEDQSSLAFDLQPAPEPLGAPEFIRALNFPDGPEDAEGIRCLRLALADRDAARLIRSAQDVLTLLAQDGIYMDDLPPAPAPAALWRRFAAGERGASVAAIGGVEDRTSLALTGARMRSDAVFRDAAHHFLRQYDRSLQVFSASATDEDFLALAETRTTRAFMLFGRVAGVFD